MKQLFLLILVAGTLIASAQSPFKALPKKQHGKYSLALNQTTSAFRFTGPIAGYLYPQNQVVTGLGYGYQKLKWIDSTGKYYTMFSVSGVLYAGGNVTPHVFPDNNVISVGISLGVLNQLIMAGPCYNLPKGGNKGSWGVVINVAVPLNN